MSKKDEVKFTQDELDKIQEFQQRYLNIQMGFGQIEIMNMRLNTQMSDLDTAAENLRTDLVNTQEEERVFIEEVNKIYGPGVLNPETGVFTPNDLPDATDVSLDESE